MQALLFLLLAVALASVTARVPAAAALAIIAAAWAGTTLPDLDLAFGLGHRSGMTHSVLPVLVACWRRRWWTVAAGLALGIGLHLSADLFPNAMRGFATVKLPGAGSIGAEASYWWFAVNATVALVAGTALTLRRTPPHTALLVLLATAVMGLTYLYRTDGGWSALTAFAAMSWLAVRGRRLLA